MSPAGTPGGGITLRSRGGQVGRRAWSRRWMGELEKQVPAGSTTRVHQARVDARHGHVLSLDHSGSLVRLAVSGSQPRPFEVEFRFTPLDSSDERLLRSELTAAPAGVLGALAGDVAEEVGFRLVPAVLGDTEWSCTCPVVGEPCRHVLAAGMVVVEWWDRSPEVLFALRGVAPAASPGARGDGTPDPFALVDPWGPVSALPEAPVAPPAEMLDLLDGPVTRRLAAACSTDPREQLRVVADLEDFYRALGEDPAG